MTRQLAFDLPVRASLGRGDFLVSPSNATALAALDDPARWPNGKLALIGPEASGKTHLAQVHAAATGATVLAVNGLADQDIPGLGSQPHVVIEDADRLSSRRDEEALFHLHNILAAEGGTLLVTARTPPARWPVTLPDLASRMQAATVVTLDPPDDNLLAAVLVKHFSDRQILPPLSLVTYLVGRMERSFAAAAALAEALDRAALARGGRLTRTLAQEILDNGPNPDR